MKTLLLALAAALVLAAQVAPRGAAPGRPAAAKSPAGSYKDLKYPAPGAMVVPKLDTFSLANGMKVLLLEDHELPVVTGLAIIRTGQVFDPREKAGLAALTGIAMRRGGTAARTGDELDEQLERIASTVETGIEQTFGSASFWTLKENADEVMGIFKDVLTAPEFRQDGIDLALTQIRGTIPNRNQDERAVASREFARIVFGLDTPYGRRQEYATLDRISRSDLQAFYKRYFFPANVVLAVYGDFDTARMKTAMEKLFSGWTASQDPVPDLPKTGGPPAGGTYLAVKREATRTYFSIGLAGVELRDKDDPALEIATEILGEGSESRLARRLLPPAGDAYDVTARWTPNYRHAGLFEIAGSAKPLSTVKTIKAIRDEVERLRASEATEEELRSAQEAVLARLAFSLDAKSKSMGRVLKDEAHGYPADFLSQYQKALAAVTRADVLRAAREHLDPARFIVMVVGNPPDFGPPLDGLGSAPVPVDVTIPPVKREPSPWDTASLAEGKRLLERAQQAVGGAAKLAGLKDITRISTYDLGPGAGPQAGARVVITERWAAPSSFRQENQPQGGARVVIYWDGKYGWIATPQGVGPLTGLLLRQMEDSSFRQYPGLLLSDRIEGRTVNALDGRTIEISDKAGNIARLVVDPDTGRPVRVLYDALQAEGLPAPAQEGWSDFREVAGIQMPYKIVVLEAGRKFADAAVTACQLNSGLTVEQLEKRP